MPDLVISVSGLVEVYDQLALGDALDRRTRLDGN
jgi:hypothetical protein